jgi:hypothetical protein
MLLNRYAVAGDGWALGLKTGSSAGVVVVAERVESLLETVGSFPVPVAAMAN